MEAKGRWVFVVATLLLFPLLASANEVHGHDCVKNQLCSPFCFFHGDCNQDGSCTCERGWTGLNCTVPVCPECVRGYCNAPGEGCICTRGFKGPLCDQVSGEPWYRATCDMFGACVCSAQGAPCSNNELPDLWPNPAASTPFIEWRTFPECDCAVDEGCAKAGRRKLLRFTMETWNIGTADLFVGQPGDYVRAGSERFIWHQCHEHSHLIHWVGFTLRNLATNATTHGWKSGSAVIDSKRVIRRADVNPRRKYLDDYQGLQVGWADWYPYWLDCQWLDVTGLPLGDYQLEITANPTHSITESDYSNNMQVVPLRCPSCVHGKCDFGTSCVCDEGWTGSNCNQRANTRTRDVQCVPNCENKSCGPDGCGESCGSCADTDSCTHDGTCMCVPQCINKYCGPDGCGGICEGPCPPNEVCRFDGFITKCEVCTPNCTGKQCGDDGCGHACAFCKQTDLKNSCDTSGQCVCVPNCAGKTCGDDGCGGSCGKCGQGQGCDSSASCTCIPNCADRECGSDGCGGSCGSCTPTNSSLNLMCTSDGKCRCIPGCLDRDCGPDGCGGVCGTCDRLGDQCHNETGRCYCDDFCGDWECGHDDCGRPCGLYRGACQAGFGCVNHACVCMPNCDGKQCGSNGCGGVCGECREGEGCNTETHKCTCRPSCNGKSCGPDGCGGLCGECATGLVCDATTGICADCVPDCTHRECGSSGCPDKNCGVCHEDSKCLNRWRCIPSGTVVAKKEFRMIYLSSKHARNIPDHEMRDRTVWLYNVSAMLDIQAGSIDILSWESYATADGTEVKVYFYLYDALNITGEEAGKKLMLMTQGSDPMLATYGFYSVKVSLVETNETHTVALDGIVDSRLFYIFVGSSIAVVGIVVIAIPAVLLWRRYRKRGATTPDRPYQAPIDEDEFLFDDADNGL